MKESNQVKSQNKRYIIKEEKGHKVIYKALSPQPEPVAVVYPEKGQERFNIDVRYLGKEFGFKSEEEAIGTAILLHEKVYAESV
ncbi:hypothetical protein [Bacillus safensis]|uniref:hypothetical protein n=1 Tax=Bacillus safensis TaxID=561879 RepID=UPI0021E5E5A3|nr:hypothetical protein [Bacillus safensis]UXO88772.1 hypothetical protein N7921_03465 [Bacillus safensis]